MRLWTLMARIGLPVYATLLVVATHVPAARLPRLGVSDKLLHLAAYAGLAALTVAAAMSLDLVRRRLRPAGWVALAVGLSLTIAAAGFADEATQPAFGRQFDWSDWAADVAGAALVLSTVVAWAYLPMQKRLKILSRMSSV